MDTDIFVSNSAGGGGVQEKLEKGMAHELLKPPPDIYNLCT